jgi:uncharacterized membrane protein
MLARSQHSTGFFIRLLLLIAAIGLAPTLVAEFNSAPLLPSVWRQLIVAGCCQSIYYIGLYRGYQSGDFTVVYPLARATPVLVIAALDVARGQVPTLFGWLGLLLIVIGCILAPLISLRDFALKRYLNATTLWIAVAALGTIGYTAADSHAAKLLSPGLGTSVRYHVLECSIALIGYWAILSMMHKPVCITVSWSDWRSSGIAAAGLFGSYALILWAFQLSAHISYIVAVRQFSVVLGVGAAVILFREPAVRFRLLAALLITGGTLCISVGG